MFALLLALLVTVFVAYMIIKKYKPQPVLMLGGLVLMALTILLGSGDLLGEKSTGFVWFDLFEFIKNTFSHRAAGLGLIIMSVGGFARYMDHIGASKVLVKLAVKPLQKLRAPYLVLALGYILGQFLNIFIPSASGLGVLLMVTMFPILVNLGVSRLAATALIGTTACLDLGPASGNSNLAARHAGLDVAVYFAEYQIPAAIAVVITIAVLHYFVQKWLDQRAGHVVTKKDMTEQSTTPGGEGDTPPAVYLILPLIPLVLILVFSKLLVSAIKMNVITAMLIGIFISMIFELIRKKDARAVLASIQVFFDGMGSQFAKVITLIVAGETFAMGLKSIGAIDAIINLAQGSGFGVALMTIVMTGIIAVTAVIMGSGNAPFFSFAALAPDVTAKMGVPAVSMLLPMQFASGIARTVSPITAVIIAVSGIAGVSTVDVVKRTAIPMAGALIATVLVNFILF